ncbi:MAG: hypothetical protein JXQ96_10440 [Cyclobacteriaceae bacterium]
MLQSINTFLIAILIGFSIPERGNNHQYFRTPFESGESIFIGLSPEDFPSAFDSVYLFIDDRSLPKFYYQDIFTPVCEDNSCKPVYITLMWDLLGNYRDYRVDPKWPLTKIDHLPFSDEEYEKLHLVLADDHSILSSYTKKNIAELYASSKNNNIDDVDAVSGATPQYIKDQTIEGALYTCHTLWNLCRGKISEQLLNHTENHLLNDDLIHQMILSGELKLIEFAFQHLTSFGDPGFHAEIIEVIQNSDQITASQIIHYLPKKLVEESDFNLQLWDVFDRVHFLSQRQILDQFTHCKQLSDKLLLDLILHTEEAKESQFVQILKIILNQSDIPENGDQLLAEITKKRKESLSGAVVILLRHAEFNRRNKDLINRILKILE